MNRIENFRTGRRPHTGMNDPYQDSAAAHEKLVPLISVGLLLNNEEDVYCYPPPPPRKFLLIRFAVCAALSAGAAGAQPANASRDQAWKSALRLESSPDSWSVNAPVTNKIIATEIRSLSSGKSPRPLLPPRQNTSSPLTPGQPSPFRIGPVSGPTLFHGDFSFRLEVPANAASVTFTLDTETSGVDVDLFVRFGEDTELQNGRVVSDYSSTSRSGDEEIVITRSSNPSLRAGTYFASMGLRTRGVTARGTLTATLGFDAAGAQSAGEWTIETVAGDGTEGFGGDGGAATAAQLGDPEGVALDAAGNLYIADHVNHVIRKVDAAGVISTVAGSGTRGFGGDGGAATAARLYDPHGVALDAAGNLYIADTDNHRIRKVDAAGVISTVAGDGTEGFGGDGGAATAAQLFYPHGVALDAAGNLYIADGGNHVIRKVDAAGVISTVAGSGTRGFGGDGGAATAARLFYPHRVALDAAGNLYIADTVNNRIRKVDAAGVISTVAGSGTRGFGGDGGAATAAQLYYPHGVALDAAGNLYIADGGNHVIRKVDAAGVISTVAGSGTRGFGGDGGAATAAQLRYPEGVALDAAGNLYIADSGNNRIRRLTRALLISSGGIVSATGTPVVQRISPHSLISVFGQGFAPQGTRSSSPQLDAAGRVAANLAATCLEIDGKRAPLFLVSTDQINAQVPHDVTPGQAQVVAIRGCGTKNEQRSPAETVAVAAVSPAFFNFINNPEGRNPIVAVHGGGDSLAGAPGTLPGAEFTPAEAGEYVTLYGTGFGATSPRLQSGEIPGRQASLENEVSFSFGGIAVPPGDITYAGAAPCCAGLYQFSVRIPSGVPSEGDVPVIATVQGVSTPTGPFLAVRGGNGAPSQAPTVTLSASPSSIQSGRSATLRWLSTDATSAMIDQSIGSVAVSGSRSVSPTSTTTYTITVTSADGQTASASATVTVTAPPSSGVCASGMVVAPGGSCKIQTSSGRDAATFTVSGDGRGCVSFICAGRSLSLNMTLGGFRITFTASKNANGSWTISEVRAT